MFFPFTIPALILPILLVQQFSHISHFIATNWLPSSASFPLSSSSFPSNENNKNDDRGAARTPSVTAIQFSTVTVTPTVWVTATAMTAT
ncbi:hypothetical protein BD289DRAFT_53048 [Coniella lustricola]|uniref:Secreted protein n=1 Tax=Coniella lustricola TaxID=2025994 RepID=A0A2T3A102_9PEZI|nr:hypothetical protein BD289DRAFT_53048 [Coniella lustricola]